jgi:hypothetical protein
MKKRVIAPVLLFAATTAGKFGVLRSSVTDIK